VSIKLKPIDQQVIVITGASSGIGLATAETAIERGAKVVLAARSAGALEDIAARLGEKAAAVPCDVTDWQQVENLAQEAIAQFGHIDTWVNNAGLGLYGRLEQSDIDDAHRLFEIDFWGVVNGSLVALPHLRHQGGALINVGSEVSEAAAPLLGMYVAAKHAVKGFTDALRIEVEEVEQASIAVTLIQPTACNTPFPQHARNYMGSEPKLPDPMIDPQQVADAILKAATRHTRSKKVGFKAPLNTATAELLPRFGDKMAAREEKNLQSDEPARHHDGALYQPSEAISLAGRRHGVPLQCW
jgi:short-subunit dehydrogenase